MIQLSGLKKFTREATDLQAAQERPQGERSRGRRGVSGGGGGRGGWGGSRSVWEAGPARLVDGSYVRVEGDVSGLTPRRNAGVVHRGA